MSYIHRVALAMAGVALVSSLATAQPVAPWIGSRVSLRAVDESKGVKNPINEDQAPLTNPPAGTLWLLRQGRIDANAIQDARPGFSYNGMPVVDIRLTPAGAAQLTALTKANVGHRIAIVVDGKIVMAAIVVEPILGGAVEIAGNFSKEETDALAAEITSAAGHR